MRWLFLVSSLLLIIFAKTEINNNTKGKSLYKLTSCIILQDVKKETFENEQEFYVSMNLKNMRNGNWKSPHKW